MKKIVYIYNPKSGNQSISKKTNDVIRIFNNKNICVIPYMIGSGNYDLSLDIIKEQNPDAIIAAGGDGTISRLVTNLKKEKIDIPIGIIPAGTCNDMSRVLVEDTLGKQININQLFERYREFNTRKIDAGIVNDRMFLNTLAGGMVAGVSSNTSQEFKKNIGKLAYYIMTLIEVGNIKPFHLDVKYDTGEFSGSFIFFMVLNGRHAGGLTNVIRDAKIDDGYLDVMLMRECAPIDMMSILISATQGKLDENRNVITFKTKKIEINGSDKILTTIDGESGMPLPFKVHCREKIINLLI